MVVKTLVKRSRDQEIYIEGILPKSTTENILTKMKVNLDEFSGF